MVKSACVLGWVEDHERPDSATNLVPVTCRKVITALGMTLAALAAGEELSDAQKHLLATVLDRYGYTHISSVVRDSIDA